MFKANDKGFWPTLGSVMILVFLIIGLSGCGGKSYSRSEFTTLTMGKTEAEVKSAMGRPSIVQEGRPPTWIYIHKTYDAAKKDDYKAALKFATDPATGKDIVVNVEFSVTGA